MRADAEDNLFRVGEDPIRDFLSEQPPMKAHLPMPNGRKLERKVVNGCTVV
jgi:hypothetical protein